MVTEPEKLVGADSPQWWARPFLFLSLAAVLAPTSPLLAQSADSPTQPYATLDRQAVTYRGPAGATEKGSPDGVAVIGVILPLQGPQQAEGKALLAAAKLALEEEQARGPLPDGRRLALAVRDESGPWGQASSEILKLIDQDHALVLLTSTDGNIAHQAEQLANKISFPILTLASDPTTTQANVPWLFRLVPSDAEQARVFSRRIYSELGFQKVLLVAQADHDGRLGSSEFEKAAVGLKAPTPELFEVPASGFNSESLGQALQTHAPEAVVIWTDAAVSNKVVAFIRTRNPSIPIYLCTKAAQLGVEMNSPRSSPTEGAKQNLGESFTVASLPASEGAARHYFEQSYRTRTSQAPTIAEYQAYEALHLIAAGLRATGANRVSLRDYFAKEGKFHDTTGIVPFDPAGNCVQEFTIVTLPTTPFNGK